jgi:POT family proton-dependent oligopeptide transporter
MISSFLKKIAHTYRPIFPFGTIDFFFAFSREALNSFLILYLVRGLYFSDASASHFVGLKDVFAYILPFIGALLWGGRVHETHSLIIGLTSMSVGCVLLSLPESYGLYLGLSFFLFGYSFGRPTLPLLVAKNFEDKNKRLQALYAFGAVANLLGPLFIGFLTTGQGWRAIFLSLGAINMVGLLWTYGCFKLKYIQGFSSGSWRDLFKTSLSLILPLVCACFFFFPFLQPFLLWGSMTVCAFVLWHKNKGWPIEDKKNLKGFLIILGAMILYFSLQSQYYMLFPLFLERWVDRTLFGLILPTPFFYMLDPLALFLFAPFMGNLFKNTVATQGQEITKKITFSFAAMTTALALAALSAFMPSLALPLMALVYAFMFVGGFLLVPTAQSLIAQFEDRHARRILMGTLYLSMAFARYGGGLIAHTLAGNSPEMSLPEFESAFIKLLMLSIALTLFYRLVLKKTLKS